MIEKTASRTRSRWFDPRLAIGLGLVVVSVIGVFAIVTASDTTVRVYAAPAALAEGDTVRPADLRMASVTLGELTHRYVPVGSIPESGMVVTRDVGAGELIPARSVATKARTRATRVVVRVTGPLPQSVEPGAIVDIWGARASDAGAGRQGEFAPPAVLVDGARVIRLVEDTGMMADSQRVALELQVPRAHTARVLEAQVRGDSLAVVPATAPRGR